MTPGSPERRRCEAQACRLGSQSVVLYRGQPKALCSAHAKTYAAWGDRDRFRMAQVLWEWETVGALRRAGAALRECEQPLPARGRNAAVRQATRSRSFGSGGRKDSE